MSDSAHSATLGVAHVCSRALRDFDYIMRTSSANAAIERLAADGVTHTTTAYAETARGMPSYAAGLRADLDSAL